MVRDRARRVPQCDLRDAVGDHHDNLAWVVVDLEVVGPVAQCAPSLDYWGGGRAPEEIRDLVAADRPDPHAGGGVAAQGVFAGNSALRARGRRKRGHEVDALPPWGYGCEPSQRCDRSSPVRQPELVALLVADLADQRRVSVSRRLRTTQDAEDR